MNSLISFLTSKEIIFVYILAGLACGVCLVVYLVEKNNENLRKKHNTRELNKLVEQIMEELNAEETRINYETPVIQSVEVIEDTSASKDDTPMTIVPIDVKENNALEEQVEKIEKIEELEEIEELEYTDVEPDQETARLELRKIEAELIRQEKLKREELLQEERRRQIEIEAERQRREQEEQIRLEEEQKKGQAMRILIYEQEQERLRREAELVRIRQEQEEEARREQIRLERLRLEQERQEKLRIEAERQRQLEEDPNIRLTKFEEEQEATAIISVDELLQKSREMYAANEETQYKDEGNEPISLQDLECIMDRQSSQSDEPYIIANVVEDSDNDQDLKVEVVDEKVMEKMKMVDYKAILEDKPEEIRYQKPKAEPKTKPSLSKFKNSPIISPIFGIERETDTNLELENTANYDKLDEQIKKSSKFIVSLKELQETLD